MLNLTDTLWNEFFNVLRYLESRSSLAWFLFYGGFRSCFGAIFKIFCRLHGSFFNLILLHLICSINSFWSGLFCRRCLLLSRLVFYFLGFILFVIFRSSRLLSILRSHRGFKLDFFLDGNLFLFRRLYFYSGGIFCIKFYLIKVSPINRIILFFFFFWIRLAILFVIFVIFSLYRCIILLVVLFVVVAFFIFSSDVMRFFVLNLDRSWLTIRAYIFPHHMFVFITAIFVGRLAYSFCLGAAESTQNRSHFIGFLLI